MKKIFLSLCVVFSSVFALTSCGGGGGSENGGANTITERQFYQGQRTLCLYSGGVEMRVIVDNTSTDSNQHNGRVCFGRSQYIPCDGFILRDVVADSEGNIQTATLEMFLVQLDLVQSKATSFFMFPNSVVSATLGSNPPKFQLDFTTNNFIYVFADDAKYVWDNAGALITVIMNVPRDDDKKDGAGITQLDGQIIIEREG